MVSVSCLCGVWNGGGVCCYRSARCVQPNPHPACPSAVLISTAVVSCTVHCWVCGAVRVTICPRSSCSGVPFARPPLALAWGGRRREWWGGMVRRGGMALKGGCCSVDPPVCSLVSPRSVSASPLLFACGPVEWRGGCGGAPCCPVLPCVVLLFLHHPNLRRVCCHSIVGLGVCLCDRDVSLWNSGDGLCAGRKGGGR